VVFGPAQQAVLQRCADAIDQPRKVLDIGCGTARLLRAARRRWQKALLLGVDISMGMLSVARTPVAEESFGARLLLIQAGAEALPLAANSVDVVTATLTYRHWADQTAGLAEIRRVLTPDGVLGLAMICPPDGKRRRRFRRRRPLTAVAAQMALAGLRIRSCTTFSVSSLVPELTVLVAQRSQSLVN
jgi:ubiquinone/menaquinone biosynthesis C-methylase UbiE